MVLSTYKGVLFATIEYSYKILVFLFPDFWRVIKLKRGFLKLVGFSHIIVFKSPKFLNMTVVIIDRGHYISRREHHVPA